MDFNIGMILGRLELFAILVLFLTFFLEKLTMLEIKKQSLSETFQFILIKEC